MENITAIVFDKTGTLTDPQQMEIIPSGEIVTIEAQSILFEMTGSSTHPLSAALHKSLANEKLVFIAFKSFTFIFHSGENGWFHKPTKGK